MALPEDQRSPTFFKGDCDFQFLVLLSLCGQFLVIFLYFFILAIVLSVLLITASDYHFGISQLIFGHFNNM
jgi:hypothetical protein